MDRIEKWRLILGSKADPGNSIELEAPSTGMDRTLEALYDSDRKGGLGPSSPNVNRWLGDIRQYFPTPVVQILQRDALERLQLDRMLLEPELLAAVEPDVHLVATLLSLSKVLPDRSRETARLVVRRVVEDLQKRLTHPLQQAVRGSLNRGERTRRPRPGDIDWGRTVYRNLRHYQPEYRTVLPVHLVGYARRRRQLHDVILLIDQSGSMASSVVYAGVMASILASLPSLRTHVVAFDVNVVNLTEHLTDPVELLFATQLGGGTDIGRALTYAERLIHSPRNTILILLSDLFEGGSPDYLLHKIEQLKASGVHLIPLLALNDEGAPAYDHRLAGELAALDLPAFACTPDQFADLMGAALRRESLQGWMNRNGVTPKP